LRRKPQHLGRHCYIGRQKSKWSRSAAYISFTIQGYKFTSTSNRSWPASICAISPPIPPDVWPPVLSLVHRPRTNRQTNHCPIPKWTRCVISRMINSASTRNIYCAARSRCVTWRASEELQDHQLDTLRWLGGLRAKTFRGTTRFHKLRAYPKPTSLMPNIDKTAWK
jgi:hypothetical protein